MAENLKDVSTHYEFGANWHHYSANIDHEAIAQAERSLGKLVAEGDLHGKSFLDIGSGSGVHSLAALRLGVNFVMAIDIDPISVQTTHSTIAGNWPKKNFDARLVSILDEETESLGEYDIVYSWGVLHHTGAMWEAIEKAARRVAPGGQFVLAIYHKTPLCWLWKIEKRIFTNSGSMVRRLIRKLFISALYLRLFLTNQNPSQYIATYKRSRGMNFYTDVDDWLGGYPYESATDQEIVEFMRKIGFTEELVVALNPKLGLFGTGCSEFRFRKTL